MSKNQGKSLFVWNKGISGLLRNVTERDSHIPRANTCISQALCLARGHALSMKSAKIWEAKSDSCYVKMLARDFRFTGNRNVSFFNTVNWKCSLAAWTQILWCFILYTLCCVRKFIEYVWYLVIGRIFT